MKKELPKQGIILSVLFVFCYGFAHSQEIITAARFMEMVSQHYATIRDFEANVVIRSGNTDMTGDLSYLSPSFLRIDFTRPAGQVIVFNGELLTVHIPDQRVTLTQAIHQSRRNPGAGLATPQGLSLLSQNYTPSFVTGPTPEFLDGTSGERVVRLRLTRRLASEGFREIILSVNPDTLLIRRIEARTVADTDLRFDITNARINQGIPEARFIYDAPPTANLFHNFLFRAD